MIPENLISEFSNTLLEGSYNLLLGSGVSLDSKNGSGQRLRSSEELRRELCRITGASDDTSLTRAYALLTPRQRYDELEVKFSNCQPGPSVQYIPQFLWRRLLSFNIDDVIENLYKQSKSSKQTIITLNYDAPFEPTPDRDELQVVHLHGWVGLPKTAFVFSSMEYVRVMSSLNPWMHLLSEILATEPFIISGTSFNEVDLEYYLSFRSAATPRRNRGPSLLVTPNPDVVTRSDCERFGLVLIPATFGEFMEWLRQKFPSPPSISDLLVPDVRTMFSEMPHPQDILRFFNDFQLVTAADRPLSPVPSPFLYGREPDWSDLDQHVDIIRKDVPVLGERLKQCLSPTAPARLVLLLDDAGTGKTTIVKRVVHDLARSGRPVLYVRTLSRIDTDAAIKCLSHVSLDLILVIDGLADHAEQVFEILEDKAIARNLVVIATERSYRKQYLDIVLGQLPRITLRLNPLTTIECQQLIERYRQYGLIADLDAFRAPSRFAKQIRGEPIAVVVCRILNDFRPLDAIVESLWEAADEADRLPYLCVALSQHCSAAGVRYSVLQRIMGPSKPLAGLFEPNVPLRLTYHVLEDDFVIPVNSAIGQRILARTIHKDQATLMTAFRELASALAPHVNRKAVKRKSPEARLAGRLFDSDAIVRPLLGSAAEEFYVSVQKTWEWNSRYWEQRALLSAETDLRIALQYARHAVAVERHQFPLTTLGKILIATMEAAQGNRRDLFNEAFSVLSEAINMEAQYWRITVHPFSIMFNGVARYLELGGVLTKDQRIRITNYVQDATYRFRGDSLIENLVQRLDLYLR